MKPIRWKELGSDSGKCFPATAYLLAMAGPGPFANIGATIVTLFFAIFIIAI